MPTTANSFVRARVSQTLRDDAGAVLQELGLTISDVMRMTLTRIAKEKEVPFELFVPNAETRAAIEEARAMRESRNLRFTNAQDMIDAIEEEAAR
ncbi:MAG: type II toxin-antitoxin system RelB/DinJ family antitoxin [Cryomorphaceae bacterium]